MRTISSALALALLLAGCGSSRSPSDETTIETYMAEEATKTLAASRKLRAELAKVQYARCEKVWNGARLSSCGRGRFRQALSECETRARPIIGESATKLDPLSAGDSWIARGGSGVRSTEQRLEILNQAGPEELHVEYIAFALANGTDRIESARCELDRELRLVDMSA